MMRCWEGKPNKNCSLPKKTKTQQNMWNVSGNEQMSNFCSWCFVSEWVCVCYFCGSTLIVSLARLVRLSEKNMWLSFAWEPNLVKRNLQHWWIQSWLIHFFSSFVVVDVVVVVIVVLFLGSDVSCFLFHLTLDPMKGW